MTEITLDEERWAEALTIDRIHGDGAVDKVVGYMVNLASCGDNAGVARFTEIIDRLDKLRTCRLLRRESGRSENHQFCR